MAESVRSRRWGVTSHAHSEVMLSGQSQTTSMLSSAAAKTNALCTLRAATTTGLVPGTRQVRQRNSIARMHWLEPSVEYSVRAEPKSAEAFSSLSRMMPSASYRLSAPAISVISSASQPRNARPLWPGMCRRAVPEAA